MRRSASLKAQPANAVHDGAAAILQRACACGKSAGPSGDCSQCNSETRFGTAPLQRQPAGNKPPPPLLDPEYPLKPLAEDNTPKTNEEEYEEGGGKVIKALLETETGKAVTDKVTGVLFSSPLTTATTLGLAGGGIAGLALTHKALPFQLPALPLRLIKPEWDGLSVGIIWKGRVDSPTEAALVFTFEAPSPAKKKRSYAEDTARIAAEQRRFRESMQAETGPAEPAGPVFQPPRSGPESRPDAPDGLKLTPPKLLDDALPPGLLSNPLAPLLLGEGLKLELPKSMLPKAEEPPLQKKLSIGASDDPLELEADRVADQVLAKPAAAGAAPPRIQRLSARSSEHSDTVPESVHHTLGSSGAPLGTNVRHDMEARFGHDFGGVRVHTDAPAARSARDVDAHAYTVGSNIVFGASQYAPGSSAGRRLLAHELTHVVQQGGGPVLRRSPDDAGPDDAGSKSDANEGAGGAVTAAAAAPQPVCDPKGFSRADFLKQSWTHEKVFGLTKLVPARADLPRVMTAKSGRGVAIQPTTAALPQIPSAFTQAGTYIEGKATQLDANGDCPAKNYPIEWTIKRGAAEHIRQGEAEHCADFQLAFDLSIGRYAAIVNEAAQSGRIFPSDKAAEAYIKKKAGSSSADWPRIFLCLVEKTELRDKGGFHEPVKRVKPADPLTNCEFVTTVIYGLSGVGKHPSSAIIKDCGEKPPAKKPVGKGRKAAEGAAASDEKAARP